MIGTYEEASDALAGDFPIFASGSTRTCYRVGDVVYKVNRHGQWDANADEMAKYEKVREMVRDNAIVSVPETSLHIVNGKSVIAMRYVNGIAKYRCYCSYNRREAHGPHCLPEHIIPVITQFVDDLGGDNVIYDGNRYWIIDMGEGSF